LSANLAQYFLVSLGMKYLNPFRLLELDASPEVSDASFAVQLKRARKAAMAEFELQDEVEINLNGIKLDRETLLRLADELDAAETRDFHRYVNQRASLEAFLADASLSFFYEGDASLLAGQSKAFLEWMAPYFAAQFNLRLIHALKQKDFEEIQVMCAVPLYVPAAYQAACYQDSYRYLHAQVEDIEQLTSQISQGEAPDGRVQEFCDEMLIDSLNVLPAYFSGVRDRYGIALENLAIEVHNTHQRAQLGMFILKQGLKLEISEETRRRLQHILDQLKAIAPVDNIWESLTGGTSSSKEKKKNIWWVALGVGAAVLIALQLIF